jgi:hypothetical protein
VNGDLLDQFLDDLGKRRAKRMKREMLTVYMGEMDTLRASEPATRRKFSRDELTALLKALPPLVRAEADTIFKRYLKAWLTACLYETMGRDGCVYLPSGSGAFKERADMTPEDWAEVREHRIKRNIERAKQRAAKLRPPKQAAFDFSTPADQLSRRAVIEGGKG